MITDDFMVNVTLSLHPGTNPYCLQLKICVKVCSLCWGDYGDWHVRVAQDVITNAAGESATECIQAP